jgi:flavoprotein
VTDYTGYDATLKDGNYLAIHVSSDDADAVLSFEVINGVVGHPKQLDEDGIAILKISDVENQKIKIYGTKNGATVTKTYRLNNLVLETA